MFQLLNDTIGNQAQFHSQGNVPTCGLNQSGMTLTSSGLNNTDMYGLDNTRPGSRYLLMMSTRTKAFLSFCFAFLSTMVLCPHASIFFHLKIAVQLQQVQASSQRAQMEKWEREQGERCVFLSPGNQKLVQKPSIRLRFTPQWPDCVCVTAQLQGD